MTLNKKGVVFRKNLLFLVIVLVVFGCAVQQRPMGGPRDRTPPKLLKATPENQTHNFSYKQIQLDFDEYFKLVDQYQEITISPAMEKPPEFKVRKKSLIIEFKDTLQKNTTYSINFGKAIADVNEGNAVKNFSYVFSTGNHIDSLSMAGTVINTLTQKREKEATVMLLTLRQDSLLFGKKKPSIYTTTDTAGNFVLSNLKENTYKIYALKEKAGDKIYNDDNELIAFSKRPVYLQHDTSDVVLKLFKQVPLKLRTERKFDTDGKMSFIFNRPLIKPSVKIIYPPALDDQKIVDFNKTRDTLLLYSKSMDFDSIKVAFLENNKPVDTVTLRKGRKETFKKDYYLTYNLSGGTTLKPGDDLRISSNLPVATYDPSYVTLNEDSTAVNFTLLKDTGSYRNFTIKYRWKQKAQYSLIFNDGSLISIYGDRNKKITKKFVVDNPDNYSLLTLKINIPDTSKAYVVELMNDKNNVLRSDPIKKNTTIVYKKYAIGKYIVRVVYDDNRNGKWDTGSIKQNKQPENIWIDEKAFILRPNFEITEDVSVPPEPFTP